MVEGSIVIDVEGIGSVSGLLGVPKRCSGVGVVLGHGAGNDMTNVLLEAVCAGLADRGHATLRFNFPYKELGRKAPDPRPRLEATYRAAVAAFEAKTERRVNRVVLGGKSMGGRIASHIAASGAECDGLIFLGYPLHPAGRPDELRDAHLDAIEAPMLFVEGTRDPLCDLSLLAPVLDRLGERAVLHVVEGGDHSFDVLKSAKRTREEVYAEIVEAADGWLAERFGGKV